MSSSTHGTTTRPHGATISSTATSAQDRKDEVELDDLPRASDDHEVFKVHGYRFEPFHSNMPFDGSKST